MCQLRVPAFLATTLLFACALPEDWDQDGYPASEDCNDLDHTIHPDAYDEPGDDIDQNCSGADVVDYVSGQAHNCELEEGTVACEGDNAFGQLDVPISDDTEWVQIAAGYFHTCGLNARGEIHCWGDNTYGQAAPPARNDFVNIAAGPYQSLGTLEAIRDPILGEIPGDTLCWGLCDPN